MQRANRAADFRVYLRTAVHISAIGRAEWSLRRGDNRRVLTAMSLLVSTAIWIGTAKVHVMNWEGGGEHP